jgi:hypothetical protein
MRAWTLSTSEAARTRASRVSNPSAVRGSNSSPPRPSAPATPHARSRCCARLCCAGAWSTSGAACHASTRHAQASCGTMARSAASRAAACAHGTPLASRGGRMGLRAVGTAAPSSAAIRSHRRVSAARTAGWGRSLPCGAPPGRAARRTCSRMARWSASAMAGSQGGCAVASCCRRVWRVDALGARAHLCAAASAVPRAAEAWRAKGWSPAPRSRHAWHASATHQAMAHAAREPATRPRPRAEAPPRLQHWWCARAAPGARQVSADRADASAMGRIVGRRASMVTTRGAWRAHIASLRSHTTVFDGLTRVAGSG